MKRILLACCLLAATCGASTAQEAATATTVTKPGFTTKVNQLDTYLGQNKMDQANATWSEVSKMMIQELSVAKMAIAHATDETAKNAAMANMKNQRVLYADVFKMKDNMAGNRAAIHEKLTQFAAAIL